MHEYSSFYNWLWANASLAAVVCLWEQSGEWKRDGKRMLPSPGKKGNKVSSLVHWMELDYLLQHAFILEEKGIKFTLMWNLPKSLANVGINGRWSCSRFNRGSGARWWPLPVARPSKVARNKQTVIDTKERWREEVEAEEEVKGGSASREDMFGEEENVGRWRDDEREDWLWPFCRSGHEREGVDGEGGEGLLLSLSPLEIVVNDCSGEQWLGTWSQVVEWGDAEQLELLEQLEQPSPGPVVASNNLNCHHHHFKHCTATSPPSAAAAVPAIEIDVTGPSSSSSLLAWPDDIRTWDCTWQPDCLRLKAFWQCPLEEVWRCSPPPLNKLSIQEGKEWATSATIDSHRQRSWPGHGERAASTKGRQCCCTVRTGETGAFPARRTIEQTQCLSSWVSL